MLVTLRRFRRSKKRCGRSPRGAATIDYLLVLCVIMPLCAFVFWAAPRMMNLVYELTTVVVSWPFM